METKPEILIIDGPFGEEIAVDSGNGRIRFFASEATYSRKVLELAGHRIVCVASYGDVVNAIKRVGRN